MSKHGGLEGKVTTIRLLALATVALLTLLGPRLLKENPGELQTPHLGVAPAAATARDPVLLHFPGSECPGAPFFVSSAHVNFRWVPADGAQQQWLDVSIFDNGFTPRTFLSLGPLGGDVDSVNWRDLVPNVAHFWRVNTLTSDGWITSGTVAFVPCGSPKVLDVGWECTGGGRANVTLRWAPVSSPGDTTWLDLSLAFNGFIPGTFIGAGPLPGTDQTFVWRNVQANVPHYFRSNAYTVLGWTPSQTGMFNARC
jgi:hypothetical protein